MELQSGYYGGFNKTRRVRTTKVHAHFDGSPLCGVKLADYMTFHFCSSDPAHYVDCERCKTKLRSMGVKNPGQAMRPL